MPDNRPPVLVFCDYVTGSRNGVSARTTPDPREGQKVCLTNGLLCALRVSLPGSDGPLPPRPLSERGQVRGPCWRLHLPLPQTWPPWLRVRGSRLRGEAGGL